MTYVTYTAIIFKIKKFINNRGVASELFSYNNCIYYCFGVLVTVHEYGHMFFAKRAGIMCPEFAIGMGPKIFSFRKNETLYTIRLLPVGGYVRMAGDGLKSHQSSLV